MKLINKIKTSVSRKEFLFICLFSLMCIFNGFIFNQFDVMLHNQAEFGVMVTEVIWAFVWRALLLMLFLTAVLTALCCFRKTLFRFTVAALLGLTLAGYIQVLFMNKVELMAVAGTMARESIFQYIVNSLIYLALIFLPIGALIFERRKKKIFTPKIALLLSIVIIGMQGVGIVSIAAEAARPAANNELYYFSVDEQLKLSKNDNVIVFVLDRFDTEYADAVFSKDSATEKIFSGFTYYKNNISEYPGTFPSVASILTSQPFDIKTANQKDYLQTAWRDEIIFDTLHENNYKVNGLIDSIASFYDFKDLEGKFDNIRLVDKNNRSVRENDFFSAMLSFAQMRQSPDALKWAFKNDRYLDIANYCVNIEDTDDYYPRTISASADLKFYNKLKENGLSADEDKNVFSFVHLQASHNPYLYDEKLELVKDNKWKNINQQAIAQTHGTFKILDEYFSQMKKLGIFESSTIILMGDHGLWDNQTTKITKAPATALFIKEKGKGEEVLNTDTSSELSHYNFGSTILEIIGAEDKKTGPSYFEIIEGGGVQKRIFYNVRWTNLNSCTYLCTYEITGNAKDVSNWKKIDESKKGKE